MPFKSQAQRRWMYSNKPAMAKRWQKHTPKGKKLPEKVKEAIENHIDAVLEGKANIRLSSVNRLFSTQLDKVLKSVQ